MKDQKKVIDSFDNEGYVPDSVNFYGIRSPFEEGSTFDISSNSGNAAGSYPKQGKKIEIEEER